MQRQLAEAVLRSPGNQAALLEALRELPPDVDVELATWRVLQVLSPSTPFLEAARRLPEPVIDRFVRHVPNAVNRDAQALFLAEAVRVAAAEDLLTSWLRALQAFADLGEFEALNPKPRRSRARVLMRDPVFRSAVQAAVASDATNQTRSMIELLAADGSEESVDALLVELERAEAAGGHRLRQLMSVLEVGARTPRLAEMLAALQRKHGAP